MRTYTVMDELLNFAMIDRWLISNEAATVTNSVVEPAATSIILLHANRREVRALVQCIVPGYALIVACKMRGEICKIWS